MVVTPLVFFSMWVSEGSNWSEGELLASHWIVEKAPIPLVRVLVSSRVVLTPAVFFSRR